MSDSVPVKGLSVRKTDIPGLLLVSLPVHGDSRGWFKENWQRAKMVAAGLPDFRPVQNNVSFNESVGTTRGIHAEPWDKYVSVASGAIFGAWVDLRAGSTFGESVSLQMGPGDAVFVPRGVGNAFQTLEPDTAYSYLVTEHWSQAKTDSYTFLNLADETVGIHWPIPLAQARLSEADQLHPRLGEVKPMKPLKTLVLGAGGQLGRALSDQYVGQEHFDFPLRAELDLSNAEAVEGIDWSSYDTIINAAAFTDVDGAETTEGRERAWAVNATAVARLAARCTEHSITLVHVSSDYVFDGTRGPYPEDAEFCPLGVYGQTKAAADLAVSLVPRHYILRTSWVLGAGNNFVATMLSLAERGIDPRVVNDQQGRLTFAEDLAAGIGHLLESGAPWGTYNLTSTGPTQSWAEIAREVFRFSGHDPDRVTGVGTEEYFADRDVWAPRPQNSELSLEKLISTGYMPGDHREYLPRIVRELAAARN